MQKKSLRAIALCAGMFGLLIVIGLCAWAANAVHPHESIVSASGDRDPHVTKAPGAEVLESALGRMIVADTGRRVGEERLAEIAQTFEEACARPVIPIPQLCFAPGTPEDVIAQYTTAASPRFFQISRWSLTASGATGGAGDPITLTYSFPPDGTIIPTIDGVDFPQGINNFNAWMNGIYGGPLAWRAIFDQVFDRWSEVSGITYVFEPNDDGANTNFSPGVLGVRGDLRICGKFLDGNSGVLAYNNFPDDGDMVFDSGDNFFDTLSNNSLRLRNVAAHEHGHGIGELHVCPLDEIKLMEPIASVAFDGPQHDDIRNAHGHYGDPNEPDNSPAQATDVGTLSIPSTQTFGQLSAPAINFGATLSIDANGEQDYFRFTVASAAAVSVTLTPIGTTYEDAPQQCSFGPAFCCSGTFTNSLTMGNLAVQVIDTNGSTVIDEASAAAAGSAETITDAILGSAGDYYVRVYETNTPSQPQLYQLTVSLDSVPFLPLSISLPNGAPTMLAIGQAETFAVQINANDESLVGGSPLLHYRLNGGSFTAASLASLGGNSYEATIPASECGVLDFYVEAQGTVSGAVTQPAGGASAPFSALVGSIADLVVDNGETDPGWSSTGDASEGLWERGIPVNNNRGDPPADFDGSGQCWLTENDPLDTNSDVDNGSAILTSPIYDVSGIPGATIGYARWLDNTAGSAPGEDPMIVEVSDNGGSSWTTLEVVGPAGPEASGGWNAVEFVISDFVTPTSQFRIRFTVGDLINGSVVEAGIDAIRIAGIDCEPVITAPAAPTGVSATDAASCSEVVVTWNAAPTAADYDVYRNSIDDSGTATMIASGVVGTLYSDTGVTAGQNAYYWVQACNAGGCSGFSASDSGSLIDVPTAVTGVAATSGTVCGAIDVTWNALAGATQYRIYRNAVDDFGTATEIDVVAAPDTSMQDATASVGVAQFYWVVADNVCGAGSVGASAEGIAGILGDFDLNGLRDSRDVQGMVQALLGDVSLLPCADFEAPAGVIDSADVSTFVGLLVAP